MATPYAWLDTLVERGWLRALNRSELVVLIALGKFVNKTSRETWVHPERVAALTGYEPSTVYHALAGLRKYGLLRSAPQEKRGRYRIYTVEVHTLVPPEAIPEASWEGRVEDVPKPDTVPVGSSHPSPNRTNHASGAENRESNWSVKEVTGNGELVSSSHPPGTNDNGQALRGNGGPSRLSTLVAQFAGSFSEPVVAALVTAGKREGWSEGDVRAEIARWLAPEISVGGTEA